MGTFFRRKRVQIASITSWLFSIIAAMLKVINTIISAHSELNSFKQYIPTRLLKN